MVSREKIRGLFLGTAIGDALGQPFESKSYDVMKSVIPINTYSDGRYSKGTWTDDTQLTIKTAQAILKSGLDMTEIAKLHVEAYKDTTSGWGSTTRNAIKKIAEGEHWSDSGSTQGVGNGIVMKIAPVAAYFALTENFENFSKFIVDFTAMTHKTSLAVSSAFAHTIALLYCLEVEPDAFQTRNFLKKVVKASDIGRSFYAETLTVDMTEQLKTLFSMYDSPKNLYDYKHLAESYGGGSCYVYNSLPFSYAFFIGGPFNVQSMINVAYAGGDTDTNASIVGGMLGALNGTRVFPEHLFTGLKGNFEILELADAFYDKFN